MQEVFVRLHFLARLLFEAILLLRHHFLLCLFPDNIILRDSIVHQHFLDQPIFETTLLL